MNGAYITAKTYVTEPEMLLALDRMCSADGMSIVHFAQVGDMMAVAGINADTTKLDAEMRSQLHKLFHQYRGMA